MEENKETLELLRKIEKNSRMQTYAGYARTVLVLVCAVCIVVLTCAVMQLMPQINAILGQAQGAVHQVTIWNRPPISCLRWICRAWYPMWTAS